MGSSETLLTAVRRRLFDTVERSQVTLEDICSIEALLRRRARAGAESADHSTFVMRQGMTVLIVLSCKSLLVVLARCDGAFLWSF